MERLNHIIDGWIFEIHYPVYISGMYKIFWNGIHIGYMYLKVTNVTLNTAIWVATTPHVGLYLEELSEFIESATF